MDVDWKAMEGEITYSVDEERPSCSLTVRRRGCPMRYRSGREPFEHDGLKVSHT